MERPMESSNANRPVLYCSLILACFVAYSLAFTPLNYSYSSPTSQSRREHVTSGHTSFREHTIATDLTGGYQVVVSDINHDGKPDLIALASGLSELVWFENPGWQRHVIV